MSRTVSYWVMASWRRPFSTYSWASAWHCANGTVLRTWHWAATVIGKAKEWFEAWERYTYQADSERDRSRANHA